MATPLDMIGFRYATNLGKLPMETRRILRAADKAEAEMCQPFPAGGGEQTQEAP